ncbi:MAG: hypothetical protein ACR2NF_11105 [Pirellulales bacterium]
MLGKLLRKKTRMRIREIARQSYVTQSGSKELVVFRAIASSQRQIKQEFGSGIISSILLSLMIKLAIRYIEGWVEDNLFSYHVPQKFEEAK